MNPPLQINKATLRGLASPEETHAMRIVLHDVSNSSPYRLRCNRRQYLFEKDGILGKHVLDIPASVWMAGVQPGRWRPNFSISEDLRTANNCPFSIQIIPWKGAQAVPAPAAQADYLKPLRTLLSNLGAPEVVVKAFGLIDAGDLEGLQALAQLSATSSSEDAAAARAAKMREAKARKKAEREAANLQPA